MSKIGFSDHSNKAQDEAKNKSVVLHIAFSGFYQFEVI